MAALWIDARCQEVVDSNHTGAAAALSTTLLSPILFDHPQHATTATATATTFATAVEHKRNQLLLLIQSIRQLLAHIQTQPHPPQHCIETVRHASYLCSKLPSIEEDECLVLFQALATFTLSPEQRSDPSGWLHEDYLQCVPVHRFPMKERLALCSCYPSVWRRYLRRQISQALVQLARAMQRQSEVGEEQTHGEEEQEEREKREEREEQHKLTAWKALVQDCTSGLIPCQKRTEEEVLGLKEYMLCPALHLMAVHELQCMYVSTEDDHCAKYIVGVMTHLRHTLQHNIECLASLSLTSDLTAALASSVSSGVLRLDAYIPNGVWLSDVTACLVRSWGGGENLNIQELAQAVHALKIATNGKEKDGPCMRQQRRNAIWLYLLQWGEHVERAGQQMRSASSEEECVVNCFLCYANNLEEAEEET